MKHFVRIIALALCLGPNLLRAQSADEQYIQIYGVIQEADALNVSGEWRPALLRYTQAQESLKKFQGMFTSWNPNVIQYRLGYVASRIAALAPKVPVLPSPVTPSSGPATTTTNPPATGPVSTVESGEQVAALKENLRRLEAENSQLTGKLKEALSALPAPVDAMDLAKATDSVKTLQKENELLKVSLDQQRLKATGLIEASVLAATNKSLTETKGQLEQRTKELGVAQAEIELLKQKKTTPPPSSTVQASLPGRIKDLERENATLQKKLDGAVQKTAKQPAATATTTAELDALRARLAVYEAKPVPFTAEELAVLKGSPPPTKPVAVADLPTTVTPVVSTTKPAKRNYRELPPGVGELFAEARRDYFAGRFGDSEKKFQEILRQDEKNVYLLGFLSGSELELHHLAEAEKHLQAALAIEPGDDSCLYQMGRLRYQQNKMDEALDALSRSVAANPNMPDVQNLLGAVLAQKGQRQAAETAFRRALILDPTYPGAHKNLALLYSRQEPPALALARWHYQKYLENNQPPDPTLERILNEKK